ncbi:protein trichome birefringence-like 36 [Macadamia integrifolia]|uniref:protein trichome birefringence-like 36 n=1 Tax=Macadamia integrifolia TaxID=60698 RepID=UPI001C4F9F90|nr:protein trichome birefringence-like 36 [Macadamia integrifolia]
MGESTPPCSCLPLIFFLSVTLFFFYGESTQFNRGEDPWLEEEKDNDINMVQSQWGSPKSCDMSVGKWVYDPSYPLYDSTCPYLSSAVNCQRNGRPDSDYEKWRWKPQGCSIPRFNALEFLGKIRRKRIMLVGDSIIRNQWESLVCLVESVIPTERKIVTYTGPTMAFHLLDFETSIEFCWAPFLVELKREGPLNKKILHLDSIEENARFWRGVDLLVFDSAHWWTHASDSSSTWDLLMEGNKMFTEMNPMVAYEKGLTTWARWVDLNLDPRQTQVIFRSVSPHHNRESGWKCYNQREPLGYSSLHQVHIPGQVKILEGVLKQMRFPVYFQDITTMSELRKDGHPSVYGKVLDQQEKQHPRDYNSDCSHWCLPGVPDTWNEMLNALI